MSQANLLLAHEVIDAVERRDAERLVELTDSDVEWRSAFVAGKEGGYRGHAGMREYVTDMNDAWDIVRLDVDHEIGVGDVVVFVGRIHYRGKGSGVEAESESGYMLKFRDGRVVTFRPFRDPEAALEAVGLSSASRSPSAANPGGDPDGFPGGS
jgi:ketosteroid isomerase-like protein